MRDVDYRERASGRDCFPFSRSFYDDNVARADTAGNLQCEVLTDEP
jgi:hypothetical protein